MALRSWSENQVFSLFQQIQSAPMVDGGWDRFHDLVGQMTHSHVAALYGYDDNADSVQLVASMGWNAAEARNYAEYYSQCSVTQRDSERVTPGQVYLETMSDPAALQACQAYNEFFLPMKADHLALMGLGAGKHARTKWGVRRSRRHGPYGEEDVALMRLIHPFLRQSLDMWSQLQRLRGLENSLYAALDQLPCGTILLDGRERLVFASRLADEILRGNDGLGADARGRCHAANGNENRQLTRLIRRSVQAGLGLCIHPGGAMAVSRPSMKRSYGVYVFPIPLNVCLFNSHSPAAAIFVTDPDRRHRPPHRVLADLFGLTPSEERLSCLMMEGLALKECAERMEISESTARSYSKAVYSKTGVSRQGDLIRLLFSSTLPFLRSDSHADTP